MHKFCHMNNRLKSTTVVTSSREPHIKKKKETIQKQLRSQLYRASESMFLTVVLLLNFDSTVAKVGLILTAVSTNNPPYFEN